MGGSAEPTGGSIPTALVKAGTAAAAAGFAARFATSESESEEDQALMLWRRRVLPPGPEGLCPSRYVRVRRFVSRAWVGPPAGRPERQPSLFLAAEPEDAARPQSPL